FLAQGRRFALSLEVHQVVDRLIARSCSLVPSPRANGRLACGPRGAHHFEIPGAEPPSNSIGSLAALMEHAGKGVQVPSLRAIDRLACGPHGARRKESPGAEPPSDSVGSLAALMEHARGWERASSPRALCPARLHL